jgi:DNA-binding NarL/FixJ family response regulator
MEQLPPIRVVVGEDFPLLREGIVHVLDGAGFDVVAATDNARELVRQARARQPDIAVIDIRTPFDVGDAGLRAAHEIRAAAPEVAVLVLAQFPDDDTAADLLGEHPEGVGYLLKDQISDVAVFTDAVRRVAHGDSVIDATVVRRLVSRRRRQDPLDVLTKREREVLALMAEGRSNRGIADGLVVTVAAVERHVTSIFAKLPLGHEVQDHRRVLAVLHYLRR